MADIVKQLLNPKKGFTSIDIASELSIEELESIITYAADKYYNTNKPVITDSLYDILIDFLKMKAPKSKVLKTVGAKVKSKDKVKLDYWLGSMDKIKPPSNQLALWSARYTPPYNLSDKLDGISALLIYDNDEIKMFTRGSAEEGLDITPLIKYLGLPEYKVVSDYCKKNKLNGDKNMIAFRGELIIKEKEFQDKFSDKMKNTRNSVSGLVNSKTINPELAHSTELVLYEVVDPFYPIDKQFKIIKELGFNCVTNKTINDSLSYEFLSNYFKQRRDKSDYLIDGIIVTSCAKHERNVDGNPDYAFAFKDILEDQMAKTVIEEIEWNVSKDGLLKPTIIVKAVTIGGVEIKRVTGNNAKFIVDNELGVGAEVEIIRSGDVIPKIQKVIKKAKNVELPKGNWHWNATKVEIVLDVTEQSHNNDMLIKNIHYFFDKLETKGLGEKNVEKIIESGLNTIKKILEASKEELLKVDGFKEKSVSNILTAIKKSTSNVSLARLMAASNKLGHGLGEERFKQVLSVYPNLLTDYKKWTKKEFIEKLIEINGWEEKTSTQFVNNFNDFITFYESIKTNLSLESFKKAKIEKGKFTDKTVVFTGFRDAVLQKKIEEQGGKIGSTVSKNTDYLVVKDQSVIDNPTEKINKAVDLNITIITKAKLESMLKSN